MAMQKIQSIAVHKLLTMTGWECHIRVGGTHFSYPFCDLAEFSDGLQDILKVTERLVPTNAVRPEARSNMQLDGLRVSDSVEYNRNMISGREARERTADGEHMAAGDWYAEIGINGTDTDCSFNTVSDLFQIVQQVIKREMANAGQIIRPGMTELVGARNH